MTTEKLFNKHKTRDLWYSTFRVVTPTGTMQWADLNKPAHTKFQEDAAQKKQLERIKAGETDAKLELDDPRFRVTIKWDNLDILKEKHAAAYTKFMDQCDRFVNAAIPNAPADQIDYPIREVQTKDGDIYWSLKAEAYPDRKPTMYHPILKEEILQAGPKFLYRGSQVAIGGGLRINKQVVGRSVVYYLRVQLEDVIHVGDGERFGARPAGSSLEDAGVTPEDLGISSQDAGGAQELGEEMDMV